MWYDHPALGPRDVIGAWLVCVAVAAVCFVPPALAVLP
jgi:hypothetical protein